MGNQSLPVLLLVAIVAVIWTSSDMMRGADGIPGGWSPITNPNDQHVQDLGKFAVTEHNNQTGDKLVFIKVVSGQYQVVAGINYKLILLARSRFVPHTYEAFVYERSWEKIRELKSFKLKY